MQFVLYQVAKIFKTLMKHAAIIIIIPTRPSQTDNHVKAQMGVYTHTHLVEVQDLECFSESPRDPDGNVRHKVHSASHHHIIVYGRGGYGPIYRSV